MLICRDQLVCAWKSGAREAKMTVHIGFVKLRMAVTTYNNIFQSGDHREVKSDHAYIGYFQICARQLLLMTIFPVI